MLQHNSASRVFILAVLYFTFVASQLKEVDDLCVVTNIEVKLVKDGIGTSKSDIEKHLKFEHIGFTNAKSHLWSCVDGRSELGILGTPGGDSGEFLLALSLYNKFTNNSIISEQQVYNIFVGFMKSLPLHRQFYMHTDGHAMEHLKNEIGNSIKNFNISNIPFDFQDQVLQLLTEPTNIGCGHIRLLVLHSEEYEIPLNLTKFFIRSYFKHMWNGNSTILKLHGEDFEVLEGDHSEQAIINVYGFPNNKNGPCSSLAPTVIPNTPINAFFVDDPVAVEEIRIELSDYFATLPGGLNASIFRKLMDDLGSKQLASTLSYLAPTKPVYNVYITYDDLPSTTGTPNEIPVTKDSGSSPIALLIGIFIVVGVVGGTLLAWHLSMNVFGKSSKYITALPRSPSDQRMMNTTPIVVPPLIIKEVNMIELEEV